MTLFEFWGNCLLRGQNLILSLLVFGQQYNQAEDEPQHQEVRGHQQEGHRVQVPSGSLGGQTLWDPRALELRGTLVCI